jgi:GNAT superfamily N-acetyltransferase
MTKDPKAIELLADELDCWLRHRFAYRARLTNWSGSTINVRRVKIDLYLRLITHASENRLWPQHTLVIARIGFREQHKGHGRALLRFLLTRAERFGYNKIAVESAGDSIGIQTFCAKFFCNLHTSTRCNSNWIASLQHVSEALAGEIKTAD